MSTIEANTEKLITELKRMMRDSQELLHSTAGAVGDKATEVRERLTETLDSAKRTCNKLEDRAIQSAEAADKIVREHPYQSIGIAFGVGLLIGVLVSRK